MDLNIHGILETRRGSSLKPFVVAAIPAYNEEKTIAKVVLGARRWLDRVVVCDDGSMDMTVNIAKELGADVIQHERNLGKGAALRSLFEVGQKIGADVLVTLDADGQHDPDDIPRLLNPIIRGEADFVIGSRFLDKKNGVPLRHLVGNKVIALCFNSFFGSNFSDVLFGFRAVRQDAFNGGELRFNGYMVEVEMLRKALKEKVRIAEIPSHCLYAKKASLFSGISTITRILVGMLSLKLLRG